MSDIHFILQGKGGVGKSLISSILFQYLKQKNISVSGIDTDPVNSTFSNYKNLSVKRLEIMNGDDVDTRRFDELVESILLKEDNGHIVVDNGAATFIPFCSYLKENNAFSLLKDAGHKVWLHSVITGGQAIDDTLAGLSTLAQVFYDVPIVVWLNRYFGDITASGKSFDQFKIYKDHGSKFHAVIEIPIKKQATFGKDLEDLFSKRETFETALNSDLPIMVRQRLKTFWNELQIEVDKAQLV